MSDNDSEAYTIRLNRNAIDSLKVHEITDDELTQLSKSGVEGTLLSFAIACGSVGCSTTLSLISLETQDDRVYVSFFCVAIISLIAFCILGFVWWQIRGARDTVVKKIRDRAKPVADISDDPTVIATESM